jgi:chemotaxis receptor (MCP) glutamine deamidase CheD
MTKEKMLNGASPLKSNQRTNVGKQNFKTTPQGIE